MKNNIISTDGLFRIPMQFFAESGSGGSGDAGDAGNADADKQNAGNTDNNPDNGNKSDTADLDKIVQSRVDKQTAELGKKAAALQKELDKIKKEHMTAEQLRQTELEEKATALAAKEKELADRENRLTAIKAIKEAGLDDGSDKSLELVDFVVADDEETIKKNVKAFGDLVKRFVSAEVDKTFKQNGRNPNSGSNGSNPDKKDNTYAEQLGKARAAKAKQSNDVLSRYIK